MESMTSIAPSVGSTTAMGLEDDANNFSMVFLCHITHVSSVRVTLDLSSNNIARSLMFSILFYLTRQTWRVFIFCSSSVKTCLVCLQTFDFYLFNILQHNPPNGADNLYFVLNNGWKMCLLMWYMDLVQVHHAEFVGAIYVYLLIFYTLLCNGWNATLAMCM